MAGGRACVWYYCVRWAHRGGSTNEGGWEEPDRSEHQVWEQLAVRDADGNVGCSICV